MLIVPNNEPQWWEGKRGKKNELSRGKITHKIF